MKLAAIFPGRPLLPTVVPAAIVGGWSRAVGMLGSLALLLVVVPKCPACFAAYLAAAAGCGWALPVRIQLRRAALVVGAIAVVWLICDFGSAWLSGGRSTVVEWCGT